jgi:hypothetical protein
MRTIERRGASRVASNRNHCPSTAISATACASIGDRPGAYTETYLAGIPTARASATTRWA